MADNIKVLGQVLPSATTLTTLYTVPASRSTVVSTLVVCNQSGTSTSFRVSVAVSGAADATNQYLYYGVTIAGNTTFTATLGITLTATDVVRVYATANTLSFNLFGVEIS